MAALVSHGQFFFFLKNLLRKPAVNRVSPATQAGPPLSKMKIRKSRPIVALVERGGNVRTFHIPVADKVSVTKIVREDIAQESRLHTSMKPPIFLGSNEHFEAHETVTHLLRRIRAL